MRTVRIRQGTAWCTGVPVASDLAPKTRARTAWVLTCAHFFRNRRGAVRVAGRKVVEVNVLPGTDIALIRLDRTFSRRDLPRVAAGPLPRGAAVTIHGRQPRPGRLILRLPAALSKSRTVVRPAGVVWATARKGDSGGPVVHDGAIYGTQALILGPLATVNLLSGHWHRLREIMR